MRFLVLAAFVLVPGAAARAEPPPGASSCSGCHALSAEVVTRRPQA